MMELATYSKRMGARGVSIFIGVHNETLSVAAMRVNNPDSSPLRING